MLTEVNVNSSAGRSRIEKELQRGKTTGKYHLSTFNLAKVESFPSNWKVLYCIKISLELIIDFWAKHHASLHPQCRCLRSCIATSSLATSSFGRYGFVAS